MSGPLSGVRVFDASHAAAGPWAASQLAQMGADVIKFESVKGDLVRRRPPMKHGLSTTYMAVNVGKRHMFLDLASREGAEHAGRMLREADVFIENFRPGAMDRLGLGYKAISALNPRIVYASSPAFGSRGPLRDMGGVETYGQAISGFMSLNGPAGGAPEAFRLAHMDLTTGSYLVQGILVALYQAQATGKGTLVEVAHMEGSFAVSATRCEEFLAGHQTPLPMDSASATLVPSRAYRGSDGVYLALEVRTPREWHRLCELLGRVELATDPLFATNAARVQNRAVLDAHIEEVLAHAPAAEWVKRLSPHLPCATFAEGPKGVESVTDTDGPLVRRVETGRGTLKIGGAPWSFGRTPGTIGSPPDPQVGSTSQPIEWLPREAPVASDVQAAGVQDLLVLDLSSGGAGPYCAMQLGSLAARVIKIEDLEGDWTRAAGPPFLNEGSAAGLRDSVLFTSLNRNKESVAVDLERVGRRVLSGLLPRADVLITDLDDTAAAALGVGYEQVHAANPRLVYCRIPNYPSVSGDLVPQACSGLTAYVGEHGQPPIRVGAHLAWLNTGAFALQAVMAALIERRCSGLGQLVELSELRSLVNLETLVIAADSDPDERIGWAVAAEAPPERGYKTLDGSVLFTFGYQPEGWEEFLRRLGLEELLGNPEFGADPRTRKRETEWELKALLEAVTQTMPSDELITLVRELGAMAIRVHTMDTVWNEPQVQAMEMIDEYQVPGVGTVRGLRMPWRFDDRVVGTRLPAPRLGEHTAAVLQELSTGTTANGSR